MIGSLRGKITFRGQRFVIIETSGVGYKVFITPTTLKKLSKDSAAQLFTYLYQRENAIELYGFLTMAEVEIFEILNSVSGIGPKSALGVLSVASIDTLKRAIASSETQYLTKVSGIGRKTAERIVIELREKFGKGIETTEFKDEEDVLDALGTLGYSLKEAREALQKIPPGVSGTERRIKEALKILGK